MGREPAPCGIRVAVATVAGLLLAGTAAGTGVPAEPVDAVCDWVVEQGRLPAEVMEAVMASLARDAEAESARAAEGTALHREGQVSCARALSCLLEAAHTDAEPRPSGASADHPERADTAELSRALCGQVAELPSLESAQARGLAEQVERGLSVSGQAEPPGETRGGPGASACLDFLRCLQETGPLVNEEVRVAEPAGVEPPTGATPWKKEFERLCSRTDGAVLLTPDELRELIGACRDLRRRLEVLDVREAKVYLFRIENCERFFQYALELKEVQSDDEGG